MKTIETMSGMVFEINNRKEMLHDIENMFMFCETDEEKMEVMKDCTLWVQYKDGTHYYVSEDEIEGTFKKINIDCIIFSNECTIAMYGNYRIINIDDIDEEYSPETDVEEKYWNVDITTRTK